MSAIPCIVSLSLAARVPAIECSSGAGCREHERLSERVIVDVPRRLDRAVDEAVEVGGGRHELHLSFLALIHTRESSGLFPQHVGPSANARCGLH